MVCTEPIREGGGDVWNYRAEVNTYLVKTHCLPGHCGDLKKIIRFMPISVKNTGDLE